MEGISGADLAKYLLSRQERGDVEPSEPPAFLSFFPGMSHQIETKVLQSRRAQQISDAAMQPVLTAIGFEDTTQQRILFADLIQRGVFTDGVSLVRFHNAGGVGLIRADFVAYVLCGRIVQDLDCQHLLDCADQLLQRFPGFCPPIPTESGTQKALATVLLNILQAYVVYPDGRVKGVRGVLEVNIDYADVVKQLKGVVQRLEMHEGDE